ncbi:MAG: hypothetical protein ACMUHX_04745 [bacterium]
MDYRGKNYTIFIPDEICCQLLPMKKKLKMSWQNIVLEALSRYVQDLKKHNAIEKKTR